MRLFRIVALLLVLCPPSAATAKKDQKPEEAPPGRLTADTFRGLALRNIGPALMSGRIADLAIHPHDQSTWYAAVGSGGVWTVRKAWWYIERRPLGSGDVHLRESRDALAEQEAPTHRGAYHTSHTPSHPRSTS